MRSLAIFTSAMVAVAGSVGVAIGIIMLIAAIIGVGTVTVLTGAIVTLVSFVVMVSACAAFIVVTDLDL